ncbi:MAG: hypothetical protein J7M06_02430 [Proteobacteria bacterium]|nr:hypothetical protein [Pseudomonadota bacterium]
MNKIKIVISVLLIFVLGAMAGSLGTKIYFKQRIGEFVKSGPPPVMHLLMRRLSNDLNLSETQEAQIEKIVYETEEKILAFKQKYHPEFEKIIDNSMELIKEKLDDRQKEKLDRLHKELKSRRGKMRPRGFFYPSSLKNSPWLNFSLIKERLNLTEKQKAAVHPIIDECLDNQRSLIKKQKRRGHHALRRELRVLEEAAVKELEAILTEEQMADYLKIQEEEREKMRSEMPRRRSSGFN